MMDVSKLSMPNNIYLEEYDVKVRPYLTMEDIMEIGELMMLADNLVVQECLMVSNVLRACTDIPQEYLEPADNEDGEEEEDKFIGYTILAKSNLWKEVSAILHEDISTLWEYVDDQQNVSRAMARFINNDLTMVTDRLLHVLEKWERKIPKGKQLASIIEGLPDEIARVLTVFKEDGNAEIVKNALEMNKVQKNGSDK